MIILTEVAKKISNILNGLDTETQGISNPTEFNYFVQTEGFHIDNIVNGKSGNFIPVFISSMGGQFNPVKGLKQATMTISIVFFYPVRFKDDFFAINDFLEEVFVGSYLNYGDVSGKAVSNISIPQYGEIQEADFIQFKNWVAENYEKTIDKNEPYLTMNVSLYLSTAKSGLIFGNDIATNFSFTYNGTTYTLENAKFDGASIQSNSQSQSEQEEGTNEADSLPFGTSYGSSLKVYPDLNALAKESTTENKIYFYEELLAAWINGDSQEIECEISFKIANNDRLEYKRKCFIQSVVAPIEIGQLLSITLTFAKLYDDDAEESGD